MRSLTRSMAYISLVLLLFSAHAIHIGDRNARDLSALQDGVVAKHQLHTHEGHHKDLPTGFAPHALYGTIKNLLEARLRKWQDGEPMLSPQIISWDPSIPLFRAQDAAWPRTSEIINGYGAKFAGGRWNPKNTPAVYTAYTDTTALEECKAASKRKDEVCLPFFFKFIYVSIFCDDDDDSVFISFFFKHLVFEGINISFKTEFDPCMCVCAPACVSFVWFFLFFFAGPDISPDLRRRSNVDK